MREILFRGKRKDNGEWVEGKGIDLNFCDAYILTKEYDCGSGYYSGEYEVIHETVGQYTGLTASNGQKIFEGDILEITPRKSKNAPVVLLVITDIWKISEFIKRGAKYWKIIGNIHDNPELMKGEYEQ